jgi:HEAT repeat protein
MGRNKAQKPQMSKARSGFQLICAFCAFFCVLLSVALAQDTRNLTPTQIAIQDQQQRLNSSDSEERRDALMRLGSMRLAAASRAALPALKDTEPIIRATAVKSILSLSPEESVAYLLPLLNDKDEFVRRETAYALGMTHSRAATAALSDRLLNDKEDGVRAAAAIALGQIADEAAVAALVGTLAPELVAPANKKRKREANVFVLRAAASALGQIRSRAGTAALIAALSNEKLPSDVRRESARSLGLIGDPSAADALKSASMSSDPYLSAIASEALKKLSRG